MKLHLIPILAVILLIAGCSSADNNQPIKSDTLTKEFKSISTGTTGLGDILIELTPIGFENGILTVDLSANTHSVDLSQYDLTQIVTLSIDGKELRPVSAPKLSGHHSSGKVVFDTEVKINTFSITIDGIPKLEKRVYTWE